MNNVNELVRSYLRQWPLLRIVALIIAIGLIIFYIAGLWSAYSAPTEKSEQVTRLTYSHNGSFGFNARVVNNDLYGNTTLTQEDTSFLFLEITENIEGQFSYLFRSDPTPSQLTHQVNLQLTISSKDNWSKSFELVSDTIETGPFAYSLPIDIDEYFKIIDTIEQQIGIESSVHEFTIRATVRTLAETEFGSINEVWTQSLVGSLQPLKLTWSGESPFTQTRQGFIQEEVITSIDNSTSQLAWTITFVFALIIAAYIVFIALTSKPAPLTLFDEEAKRAKKKYEDNLVDVDSLPEVMTPGRYITGDSSETVVPVSSLDELIKISETLFKPVLHQAEKERHVYRILDGFTVYEYTTPASLFSEDDEQA